MNNLHCLMKGLSLKPDSRVLMSVRHWNVTHFDIPDLERMANREHPKMNYRRKVYFPKNHLGEEQYTVKPLKYKHLAGRDPVSGRVVAKHLGGGIKEIIQWVYRYRTGPKDDSPPKEEKVLQIIPKVSKSVRTADLAMVGDGSFLKLILATENMKAGDIIKTSQYIPRIPVRAKEGDAYPLGALPVGTQVCCVEKFPGEGSYYGQAAGTCVTILRSLHDTVILRLPSKQEVAVNKYCMATVGRISNPEHEHEHVGTPNRQRELGNRPKSGLWKRKTGYHGRKIRPLPPLKFIEKQPKRETIQLTMPGLNMITRAVKPNTGLGHHEEPRYMSRIRLLQEEEQNAYTEEEKDL